MISNNPNATVSGVSGIGVGSLLVWALGRFGVNLDPVAAAAIASTLGTVALFIGRNGYQGVINRIRYGSGGKPAAAPPAPPAPPAP